MAEPAFPLPDDSAISVLLAERLALSDAALGEARPILRYLLGNDDHAPFSDRIVAAVRAQLRDIAFQLVVAVETAAGAGDARSLAEEACDPLAMALAAQPLLLGHAHALALETVQAEWLAAQQGLDPVLSPLLQELIASSDPDTSAAAMTLLAAQARFGQTQRRGELPLGELPGICSTPR